MDTSLLISLILVALACLAAFLWWKRQAGRKAAQPQALCSTDADKKIRELIKLAHELAAVYRKT